MFIKIYTCKTLVLLSMALSLVSTQSQAGLLDSGFIATYEVVHTSIYLGDAVRKFQSGKDGTWIFSSDTAAKGLVSVFIKDVINEESIMRRGIDGYAPSSYKYHQHGGKKEKRFELLFDWDKNIINNNYTNKDYNLKSGTHDLLSFQVQLMQDLQNNKQEVEYIIADKKRVEAYTLKVVKETTLEIPFKTIKTIELISNKIRDKLQFKVWCAPELNYLPIRVLKIDDEGDETELTLKKLSLTTKQNSN